MNMIGALAASMTKYQDEIQMAVGIILLVLIVFFIIRAFVVGHNRRKFLSQIHTSMEQLQSSVNALHAALTAIQSQQQGNGMVYIDNRMRNHGAADEIEIGEAEETAAEDAPAKEPAMTDEPEPAGAIPAEAASAPEEVLVEVAAVESAPMPVEEVQIPAEEPSAAEEKELSASADAPALRFEDAPAPRPAEPKMPMESAEQSHTEQPQVASKYFTRDCGVAKDGRVHTVEELNDLMME